MEKKFKIFIKNCQWKKVYKAICNLKKKKSLGSVGLTQDQLV